MDNVIQFPEGYRYRSDIEVFRTAVDCAKELLEDGRMSLNYQFIDSISAEVFVSQDVFEREYDGIGWDDFMYILDNEIIYLLRQNFEGENDVGLKRYLKENKVPKELREKIIQLKSDKCEYVNEYLGGEREKKRYALKKRTVLKKLSDMDFDLSRTVDEEEIVYATIKMSVNTTLEGKNMPRVVSNVFNQGEENITFICDKSDIECLIQKLEKIKNLF